MPPDRVLNHTTTQNFQSIRDKFTSYEQVQQSLNDAGLESSNLIIAIDFTKVLKTYATCQNTL